MGKIEIHDAALGNWKSFKLEKENDGSAVITVTYENDATAAYIATQIHDGLVGNESYRNNEIVLNYEGPIITIVVAGLAEVPRFLDAVLIGTETVINTIF